MVAEVQSGSTTGANGFYNIHHTMPFLVNSAGYGPQPNNAYFNINNQ